jgi:hypothetical protein
MPAADAVPFAAPAALAAELDLPNAGRVRGLGVRAGVTLVVGGGFHGKSTLLEALQAGVYNKARPTLTLPYPDRRRPRRAAGGAAGGRVRQGARRRPPCGRFH